MLKEKRKKAQMTKTPGVVRRLAGLPNYAHVRVLSKMSNGSKMPRGEIKPAALW